MTRYFLFMEVVEIGNDGTEVEVVGRYPFAGSEENHLPNAEEVFLARAVDGGDVYAVPADDIIEVEEEVEYFLVFNIGDDSTMIVNRNDLPEQLRATRLSSGGEEFIPCSEIPFGDSGWGKPLPEDMVRIPYMLRRSGDGPYEEYSQ